MADSTRKALIVVTSHDRIGESDRKTGFYFDEMATPYWALADAGFVVDIASIKGGVAPYDPGSAGLERAKPAAVERFLAEAASLGKIQNTVTVDAVDPRAYSVVFLPGGHGTMWDFAQSKALGRLIGDAYENGAIIGAVCHGPAGLIGATRASGEPLVAGRRINSFTDAEEEAVGLTHVVPYLLESKLRELGSKFEAAPNFQPKVVRDGRLVTGQNPQSAALVAHEVLRAFSANELAAAE